MYDLEYEPEAPHTLHSNALLRGQLHGVWAKLTRRSRRLLSLAELTGTCTVQTRRKAGLQMVPIRKIRGSEGRCRDFDRDFNPIQAHTGKRWRGVARARMEGKGLPPVELIRVGDTLFVRDGHHRISVARALGQQDIEAEVTVWHVAGRPPWEKLGTAPD